MKSDITNNNVWTRIFTITIYGVRNAILSNQMKYKPDTLVKILEAMSSLYSFYEVTFLPPLEIYIYVNDT